MWKRSVKWCIKANDGIQRIRIVAERTVAGCSAGPALAAVDGGIDTTVNAKPRL